MISLLLDSLIAPRRAAGQLLRLPYDRQAFLLGAGLLACVSGIVSGLFADGDLGATSAPIIVAIRQLLLFAVLVFGIDWIGRFFGGQGDIDGALRIVVWHSAVEVVSMALIIVLVTLLGPMALFVMLLWLFYILAVFVQELHGFRNLFLTMVGLIGGGIAIGIPAMLLLQALGLMNLEAIA